MSSRIYKGYELVNLADCSPYKCRWWQAENVETGEADFHANTMRDLMAQIDASLVESEAGVE